MDLDSRGWSVPQTKRERFALGFVGGSVCSLVFWVTIFSRSGWDIQLVMGIAIAFVLAKLVIGLVLTARRGWTPTGLGILISMGVGGLIVAGTCFVSLASALHH